MSPKQKRRPNTTRVVVYLDDNAMSALNDYIDVNYTAADSYGAVSHTVSEAVEWYCSDVVVEKGDVSFNLVNDNDEC